VLDGRVTVYYGNEVIELEKGDSIYLDSIVNHLVTAAIKSRILGIVYIPFNSLNMKLIEDTLGAFLKSGPGNTRP
jgi:quercetin dioxygenase-like cupin family protein